MGVGAKIDFPEISGKNRFSAIVEWLFYSTRMAFILKIDFKGTHTTTTKENEAKWARDVRWKEMMEKKTNVGHTLNEELKINKNE